MRRAQLLVLAAALVLSCVDPVNLSLPTAELPLIFDGNITDNPTAPDTILLLHAYPADGKYHNRNSAPGAKFWISNSAGVPDTLLDLGNGKYVTDHLQGSIGETYTLHGTLPDGTTITSSPQQMLPAGTIDSIYHELTSILDTETGVREEGINVFVNATVGLSSSRRMRWKFGGTYSFVSDPSLITMPPLACATGCVCCTCWASEREDLPLVTNPALLGGGTAIDHVFVKYIPINGFTFYEKYRVEVTQMELASDVFDYYTNIRKQMKNAASLFQPPFFELDGNVSSKGGTKVIGVFTAAAETKAVRYIYRSEVPYQGTSVLAGDCRAIIHHSNNVPPPFWN